MSRARITVNAVAGSDTDLPVGQVVQLDNDGDGSESTFAWQVLDQPEALPADVLSDAAIQNPTIPTNKEGTYLVELVVDAGLPTEDRDRVVLGVRYVKTRERAPAAGEEREADADDGWAPATNRQWEALDALRADPGTMVAEANGALAVLDVVRYDGVATLKAALPGEEEILTVTPAPATGPTVSESLGVVLGRVDDLAAVGDGELAVVRWRGLIPAGIAAGAVVGGTVFVDDAQRLSLTPGSVTRPVGIVVAATAGVGDVFFFGGNPDTVAASTTFLGLTDTPASYAGQAGRTAIVNPATNALIFSDEATTLVFRPGEPSPSGRVFADFNALYTRFQSTEGPVVIWFDDSLAATTIPSKSGGGAYDWELRATFAAEFGSGLVATCPDNCEMVRLAAIEALELRSENTLQPVITAQANAPLLMGRATLSLGSAVGTLPVIDVPTGVTMSVVLERTSWNEDVVNGAPVVELNGTGVVVVLGVDGAVVEPNTVDGAAGSTLTMVVNDTGADLSLSHSGMAGTIQQVLGTDAPRLGYTPTTSADWSPVPDNAQDALDQAKSVVMREGGGPTNLTAGDVADGEKLLRVGTVVRGAVRAYGESEGESTTTSLTYVQKLRVSLPASAPAGTYRVHWSFTWRYAATVASFQAQVELDDTTQLWEMVAEPQDSAATQRIPASGFKELALGAGAHDLDLDFLSGGGDTAGISQAHLSVELVGP